MVSSAGRVQDQVFKEVQQQYRRVVRLHSRAAMQDLKWEWEGDVQIQLVDRDFSGIISQVCCLVCCLLLIYCLCFTCGTVSPVLCLLVACLSVGAWVSPTLARVHCVSAFVWLYCTVHCAKKIVSARLGAGSASTEWIGWGGVTHRVLCTWHPLTWL